MANKALITRRAGVAADVPMRSAIAATRPGALVVEAETPAGPLIRGADSDYEALEAAGFRVKLLSDTHLLLLRLFNPRRLEATFHRTDLPGPHFGGVVPEKRSCRLDDGASAIPEE
jgi:hypothetical protein